MWRRLERRSAIAEATELVTLTASLDAGASPLPPLADAALSCSSSAASSASMIHGGLFPVAQATADSYKLAIVSGSGAPTERMNQRT